MTRWCSRGLAVLVWLMGAGIASAQDKSFVLAADQRLAETGLLSYLVPRFALKYGIRPSVVTSPGDAVDTDGADVVLAPDTTVAALAASDGAPAFYLETEPVESWSVALLPDGANGEHAERFIGWLTGEIGQRAVASFSSDDAPEFLPGAIAVEIEEDLVITGDATEGEKLALFHCGRCHVVNEKNRMGGIGSTPSFAALRAIPDWAAKFRGFYQANPHPSFTQVDGVTDPFDPNHPPHIAPVEITVDDIDAIFAYAASIPPKDLGAPVEAR